MKALLLTILGAFTVTACAPQKANLVTVPALTPAGLAQLRVAIDLGVSLYLGKHPGSIGRAKLIAEGLLSLLKSDPNETTSVAALEAFAYAKVDALVPPADQQAAHDMIQSVAMLVQQYVGDGQVNGQALVDLRDVLGTISYAVEHYVPTG